MKAVPFRGAALCNLLEDGGPPMAVVEGEIEVRYRPHQIIRRHWEHVYTSTDQTLYEIRTRERGAQD